MVASKWAEWVGWDARTDLLGALAMNRTDWEFGSWVIARQALALSAVALACSGVPAGPTCQAGSVGGSSATSSCGTGGAVATGGTSATGGKATGGSLATGGSSSASGGTGCPALTGADLAYPRWPMPNPASQNLPNPASYTDLGDGTVKDNVTSLIWQKAVTSSQSYAWADAQTYCAGLTVAGLTWHLPTRIELLSIVDYTKSPAIDATAFPSTPGGKYHWTSTPWVVSQISTKPQDAWMVNFSDGGLDSNAAAQTAVEYARCVSGPATTPLPNPHYVQVATGEVQDVATKLVWVQASSLTTVSQAAAVSYCTGLGLNGHTWRLPSVSELLTLVNDNPNINKVSPAIDQCVFADTPANAYYMSSSSIGSSAWALNYQDGYTSHSQTTGVVRCVR